jgi:cell division initiation protein
MAITAQDIQEQGFSVGRKGYDVDEVDVFLERVADEIGFMNDELVAKDQIIADLQAQLDEMNMAGFDAPTNVEDDAETTVMPAIGYDDASDDEEEADEPVSTDVADLQAQIADLKGKLSEKTADSSAISAALIVAQRSADDIVSNAKVEANRIVKEAEDEADRIVNKAESDREKVQNDIEALEDDRDDMCDGYRSVLTDFIADAQRKLEEVNAKYSQPLASHARVQQEDTFQQDVLPAAAAYQVPIMGSSEDAPEPVAFSGDKDLSGFGDVVDDFDFDDPE